MSALSVVLIGPEEDSRVRMAQVLTGPQANIARQLTAYPEIDDLAQVIDAETDVVIVDLDSDPERALDVVDNVCSSRPAITMMVYSGAPDPELLVRCMRAGAREFLTQPVLPGTVSEALVRASVRRDEVRRHKRATGKLFVFAGAKGGAGVTTVATNFAVAMARDNPGKVALVDLNLHLGDAALSLGLTSRFSVTDAFENIGRLDSDFISALLQRHSSGLMVLGAPDKITHVRHSEHDVDRLFRTLRDDFAYVVVDAGSSSGEIYEALFDTADTVYLVTQTSVGELRNANRFVSSYFNGHQLGKLEIILNRFVPKIGEFDEATIAKALTRPPKWKIPNDFAAVRRAQNTGIAIASEDTPIARVLSEMARAASGQLLKQGKKRRFGLFG